MTPEKALQVLEAGERQLLAMTDAGWFQLDEGGKLCIARFVQDDALRRRRLQRYSFVDFERKFSTVKHFASKLSLGKAWIEWSGKKSYDRVVFRPLETTDPNVLNLWEDFGVPEAPGGSSLRIQEHLQDVVCSGDTRHYRYLLAWMARLIQKPGALGEVAVVLRGKEGTGKSVCGKILRRILGQHALAVSSSKHVTGEFNQHLADCVFLEASEAFFAGDKATYSKLKALITEDTLTIERKGVDAVQWPNRLTIFITSNDPHVIQASPESRRYFVLEVSDKKRGDKKYFDALHAEVDDPISLGHFLHVLLNLDLRGFDHRDFPEGSALFEQRERSASGVIAWSLDLLARGGLLRTPKGEAPWRQFFATEELYNDYTLWVSGQRYEKPLSRNLFVKDLKTQLGLSWLKRPGVSLEAPSWVRELPGIFLPDTLEAFEAIVQERAGLK